MTSITTDVGGRGAVRGPMIQAPVSPPPRPGAAPGAALTPQDIFRIVKRWIWLMLAILALVMVLTVVGTYVWATWYPTYTAVGLVEVKTPIVPPALRDVTQMVPNIEIFEQFINTQAAMIRNLSTLQQALEDPLVRQTSWFKSFEGDVNAATVDMQENRLGVAPIRDTQFVQVSFRWRVPSEAATIVNAVLDTYYRNVKASAEHGKRDELARTRARADALKTELERATRELETFREVHQIPVIEQRRTGLGEEAATLRVMLQEAYTERDRVENLYNRYNAPNAMQRMAETPEMRQLVENDPQVRYMTSQLADFRRELDAAKERGPNNMQVRSLQSRMESLQRQLNAKRSELIANSFRDMKARTEAELDRVSTQVLGLRERLAEAKAELDDLEQQLATYLDMEKEVEALRTTHREVEDYANKLQITLENPELVRVRIPSKALRPIKRSSPRWIINIPAGFVLGVMLAFGVAVLLEYTQTTVRRPAEVVRQLHMPLLGQIPSQDDDEASPEQMHKVLEEAPHSLLSESFRQLRANLLFSAPEEHQRTILVCSCTPQEGKTCIAVNLAGALALAGRKVLLVDANFRRPGVADAFGIANSEQGLTNVLIGGTDPESLIHKTGTENLDILPAGPVPPNPAELLGSGHLRDFINKFSSRYQTIMFDGPPLLVVSDALVLAVVVDGVVMVIRAGRNSRGTIQRAREQLSRTNARLLGVVLNDVKVTRGGYLREVYRTYYDYQTPTDIAQQ